MQHYYSASVTHSFFNNMPSHRKRIGFLPSEEVHEIIEKICSNNNYSQSKVTGILVEEALRNRGVLKNIPPNTNFIDINKIKNNKNEKNFERDFDSNITANLKYNSRKDDLKMINEFIEYKLFKRILNENREIFD